MSDRDWDEHYARGEIPWNSDEPDDALVAMVEAGTIPSGKTLEVGCGTGTNALWLAGRGFDVLGVDVSPLAIEMARGKLAETARPGRFEVLDFLTDEVPGGPFDFVFDRGVFHVFDDPDVRTRFAARVAGLLVPGGSWLSLIGSTEGAPRDTGPPRRSAIDVVSAVEPALEVLELRSLEFDVGSETPPRAWLCLARARTIPAQPSTGS